MFDLNMIRFNLVIEVVNLMLVNELKYIQHSLKVATKLNCFFTVFIQ